MKDESILSCGSTVDLPLLLPGTAPNSCDILHLYGEGRRVCRRHGKKPRCAANSTNF